MFKDTDCSEILFRHPPFCGTGGGQPGQGGGGTTSGGAELGSFAKKSAGLLRRWCGR